MTDRARFEPPDSRTIPSRIHRMMRSVPQGERLLRVLTAPAQVKAMVSAAESGKPSVAGASGVLVHEFADAVTSPTVRQFIGLVVRWIMEGEGYALGETGVKLRNDPIFTSGARYRRVASSGTKRPAVLPDMIGRILHGINDDELKLLRLAVDEELARRHL